MAVGLSPYLSLRRSRFQEPEVLMGAGVGRWVASNGTLQRARLLPCSEFAGPVRPQVEEEAWRRPVVSSTVRGREGPFYKSPHRQGFYTSRTCVTLFTLLPATPLQRKPVPAGKVAGVILSVCACGRRGCYMHGIRPGSSKPSSFPQGPTEEDSRGLQRPSVMVTGPQQQNLGGRGE